MGKEPTSNLPADRLSTLPSGRRAILERVKARGTATVAELSADIRVSREAIRQSLVALERDGWIRRRAAPSPHGPGRRAWRYALTGEGEELFPKRYGDLLVGLVDSVAAELGPEALSRVLARVTDARVDSLRGATAGKDLAGRLDALRAIYEQGDPWVEVRHDEDGWRLVERNCPFLRTALARPALCSTTVSVLARLLGVRVVRERRFQAGDGCCVFRVLSDEPLPAGAPHFEPEPPPPAA